MSTSTAAHLTAAAKAGLDALIRGRIDLAALGQAGTFLAAFSESLDQSGEAGLKLLAIGSRALADLARRSAEAGVQKMAASGQMDLAALKSEAERMLADAAAVAPRPNMNDGADAY